MGLEKPDPEFFRFILQKENLLDKMVVMIGNNIKNDAEASQKVGIIGVLFDPSDEHPEFHGLKIKKLSEVFSLLRL